MNVHIPQVICLDCNKAMTLIEGTTRRICGFCDKKITIEVVEE